MQRLGKRKGIEKKGFHVKGAEWNIKNKIEDEYPLAMPVDLLSRNLNLPYLQQMVDDIVNNYITRPASKKFILIDYPEKLCMKKANEGKNMPYHIDLPPALKSLLSKETRETIYQEWKKRFPVFTK